MKLDVRTKFVLLIFTNYLLLHRISGWIEWSVVLGLTILFISAKKGQKGLRFLFIFIVLYSLAYFVIDHVSGNVLSFLSMLTIGGRLMLPCFMAGSYLLSTSSVRETIHALRKCYIPESILLTFAVMMRFLPVIGEEYRAIRQSLKLRGIFMGSWDIIKSPVKFFEYIAIPLLMSASRTAQDLTIATLTKSIGASGQRTAYREPCLKWQDKFVMVGLVMIIVGMEMNKWL